ncbi:MAG: sigma-70 family RNA polymerase sigma factor, partial [Myxococcales bacterium]|nr:sigma-70 family RNA polymerase sigma factor [Myxococcales bacterium]
DRDGRSVDEAVVAVATRHGLPQAEVAATAQALPVRSLGRSRPADADLSHHPSPHPLPDELTRAHEASQERGQLRDHLAAELDALSAEDRLALRLRFAEGLDIRTIAATLGQPQRPFYRHLERILGGLRSRLVGRGVDAATVRELLELGDLSEPNDRPPGDVLEMIRPSPSLQPVEPIRGHADRHD